MLNDNANYNVTCYEWNDNAWVNKGASILTPPNPTVPSTIVKLSDDGNRLIVGSQQYNDYDGIIESYSWDGTNWNDAGKILGQNKETLGTSLDLSADGSILVSGGRLSTLVKTYFWESDSWSTEPIILNGGFPTSSFGYAISLDPSGEFLAVGAPGYFEDRGKVNLYQWKNNLWEPFGNEMIGDNSGTRFGSALALSENGKRLLIGQPLVHTLEEDEGLLRAFEFSTINSVKNNSFNIYHDIYPNPTSEKLTINFELTEFSDVSISLVDFQGVQVRNFISSQKMSGKFQETFNVTDVPGGSYLMKLKINEHITFKKIIIKH